MKTTARQSQQASIENDPRWTLLSARKKDIDGTFYYSVKTTGVYCRPSCAARLPRPENVQFYSTFSDAEAAGFRPCKRCHPDLKSLADVHTETVANICKFIDESESQPSLNELADRAGMSVYHFHRTFKLATGLTPKAYGAASLQKRIRIALNENESVTEAIYDAGYNSSGRFYETSNDYLGMTPTDFRAGGANSEISFAVAECSLGPILIATSRIGICAILMGDDPNQLVRDLQDKFPNAELIANDAHFEKLVSQVIGFIEAPSIGLALPLDIRGTAFQQRVWQALRNIEPGATATYTDIAKAIGAPKSVRAVANACGSNVIAVAIPCHRVVRNDGALSGYRWGVERKRSLLNTEGNL